jgi:hypothetical protein
MNYYYDFEDDVLATPSDAVREYVRYVGSTRQDSAWILSQYDTWELNPYYSGPPQPHPEDDMTSLIGNDTGTQDVPKDHLESQEYQKRGLGIHGSARRHPVLRHGLRNRSVSIGSSCIVGPREVG